MESAAKGEILIVEDELAIRKALCKTLEENGYCVRPARNGEQALQLHRQYRSDLILLDVMMPGIDGYSVCERIRETDSDTPIAFLTALDSEKDELRALQSGGDAFIPKTVSEKILLGRISAVIRRHRRDEPKGDFSFAGWRILPRGYLMRKSNGCETPLTDREIALLRIFAAHPDEVISRDYLISLIWGIGCDIGENALTVAIGRLRGKLEGDGRLIESVRATGYVYHPRGNSPQN